ncbi:hypothetical protein F53441_10898 [Fusarium austroafricanum]|uniref:Nephrocystin 3-like N-terminal domain-containing protein n=1 Tax=Fusarium austroafricanum TaxID=2364996 RepID=A0A8H4NNU3_9HYPO|nr:hypothetical protein F53441_10898 [Fusarium austroafricanum]
MSSDSPDHPEFMQCYLEPPKPKTQLIIQEIIFADATLQKDFTQLMILVHLSAVPLHLIFLSRNTVKQHGHRLGILGAASAVIQVIHFASNVASICKKVYDGEPTVDNELEECAKEMYAAAGLVRSRCWTLKICGQSSQTGKELLAMADRCQAFVRELQTELQHTTGRQKSQNDALHLLEEKWFLSLQSDVQILARQISKGHFQIEALIRAEHEITRQVVFHQTSKAQEALKEYMVTERQREDFVKSFRFPEIKKRYNDLKHPTDKGALDTEQDCNAAPGMGREEDEYIDETWTEFTRWLTSSHQLFCIQGKPGSGKSTLLKFIVENENTKALLSQWSPDISILSHFFWKIGIMSQHSIKGLLCSLIYQLLTSDQELLELTLRRQGSMICKHYNDWETQALVKILQCIVEARTCCLCIFVDGLDEISNEDGIINLTQTTDHFLKLLNTKFCVSSRPDILVSDWLRKYDANSILLEDLTRPEMIGFTLKELGHFVSSQHISLETSRQLTNLLVQKSQGVFLWLYLVLRSLSIGIRNRDPERLLIRRLEELPSELEKLYADMW